MTALKLIKRELLCEAVKRPDDKIFLFSIWAFTMNKICPTAKIWSK